MSKTAELQLQLRDPRPCSALQAALEQALQRLRFRVQERRALSNDAGVSLKAVEQAHWWSGQSDARLPIWISLELSPQPSGTELTINASLELAGRTIGPLGLALVRSRVVRLCRLSECPAEQMQELLQRHQAAQRQQVALLALVALLGVAGAALSLREGGTSPDQPVSPQELNSVVP